MFALTDGNIISVYPYSDSQLRADHPNTSFPTDISPELLASYGVVAVEAVAAPAPDAGYVIEEAQPIFVGGVWKQAWAARAMTQAEIKATVPVSVTPLQIRKALRQAGLKSAVDAYLANLSDEVVEEWEYAIEMRRDNATLNAAAAALGMTEAQADDLFRLAASLA